LKKLVRRFLPNFKIFPELQGQVAAVVVASIEVVVDMVDLLVDTEVEEEAVVDIIASDPDTRKKAIGSRFCFLNPPTT
jgi:hypothetical protein